MAKKSSVLRNNKRIKMAKHQTPIRAELRAKAIDPKLSDEERFEARMSVSAIVASSLDVPAVCTESS
jgi:small subunit ribosomal protein S14